MKTTTTRQRRAHVTGAGVLVLKIGGEEWCYWIDRVPSDYGAAFSLKKFVAHGPETYQCCIDTDGRGRANTCCCLGFSRYGRCKHTAALRALLAAGRMPGFLTK